MSTIDFTRPRARARRRARRRRPPSLRAVYLKCLLLVMLAHCVWLTIEVMRGTWALLIVLVLFMPSALYIVRIGLERAREYERIGHPQSVGFDDWLLLAVAIGVEAVLWTILL